MITVLSSVSTTTTCNFTWHKFPKDWLIRPMSEVPGETKLGEVWTVFSMWGVWWYCFFQLLLYSQSLEMMRLCQVHQPQHRSEFISPEVFFFSHIAFCTIATYSKHHIPTSSSFILYSDQNDSEQICNFANTIGAKGFWHHHGSWCCFLRKSSTGLGPAPRNLHAYICVCFSCYYEKCRQTTWGDRSLESIETLWDLICNCSVLYYVEYICVLW
jgi:hypothetical protein